MIWVSFAKGKTPGYDDWFSVTKRRKMRTPDAVLIQVVERKMNGLFALYNKKEKEYTPHTKSRLCSMRSGIYPIVDVPAFCIATGKTVGL